MECPDCKYLIVVLLIGKFPDVIEMVGPKRLPIRFGEWDGNFMRSREDPK